MAAVCDICGKAPGFGKSVSHSHRRTNRRWDPNIQTKTYYLPSEGRRGGLRVSAKGIKVIDREIVLSQKFNITLILDELDFDNLAIFFSGEAVSGSANPAATAADTDVQIATDAIKGRWYEVRQADGDRLLDLKSGAIVVKSGAGAATNTLVLGTDYEVDLNWGRIFLRPESVTFVNGHELYYSYTGGTSGSGTTFERVIDTVDIATQSKQSLFLSYIGINPANNDQEIMLNLHSVSLRADGDLSLIGDEFSELTLSGVAEKNETGYPDAPVGKAYYHAGA